MRDGKKEGNPINTNIALRQIESQKYLTWRHPFVLMSSRKTDLMAKTLSMKGIRRLKEHEEHEEMKQVDQDRAERLSDKFGGHKDPFTFWTE